MASHLWCVRLSLPQIQRDLPLWVPSKPLTCPTCLIWKNGVEVLASDWFDVDTPLCPLHESMKNRGVKLTVRGLVANRHQDIALDTDSLKALRARLRKRLKMPAERERVAGNGSLA